MSCVVAFTGHMVDQTDRPVPRFPPAVESDVKHRIGDAVSRLDVRAGFGSAACGGDILFHETVLARGGEVHIVLPCPEDEFIEACIDIVPGGDWKNRFEDVIQQATSIERIGEQCAADNSMASECCNRVVLGLGKMQAQADAMEFRLLALWDGRLGDRIGGTHSMVEFSRRHGHGVQVINIGDYSGNSAICDLPSTFDDSETVLSQSWIGAQVPQQICAMVFADVVEFSKLKEQQLPEFARHYLGGVMSLLLRSEVTPLARNTWGDGLYLVFPTVRAAGIFALELRSLVADTDWTRHGLPPDFNVRIGTHAGPVYQAYDPIIGQWSYIGSHVTQAARIEPTTPPGEVYASRTFAALAAAEGVDDFACVDVGMLELAKDFGMNHVYRVLSNIR